MYYHFLGGIITETNFDLILSFDDECFQITILFLVSAQYISPVHSKTEFTENYPDSQIDSQQKHRIPICCTLSISIVNACFEYCISEKLRYKKLVRPIKLSL